MDSRFFNAGDKIEEMFPFSLPDGADVHVIGRWMFVAPKQSWMTVPSELLVGSNTIHVDFAKDIRRRFGKRGVVLLDPKYDPALEDPDKPLEQYAVAPSEELVIERAEKLWDNYLDEMCRAHFEDVQNAMSSGGAPRRARGFTVHALKLKGYRDPAEDYFLGMKDGKAPQGTSPELTAMFAQMQQQNSLMMGVIVAIASGQKVDPELLKSMAPVPGEPQQTPIPRPPAPSNGDGLEVVGQSRIGVEERINRREDTYTPKPKLGSKSAREAAAAKAL